MSESGEPRARQNSTRTRRMDVMWREPGPPASANSSSTRRQNVVEGKAVWAVWMKRHWIVYVTQ